MTKKEHETVNGGNVNEEGDEKSAADYHVAIYNINIHIISHFPPTVRVLFYSPLLAWRFPDHSSNMFAFAAFVL